MIQSETHRRRSGHVALVEAKPGAGGVWERQIMIADMKPE